jgi:PAS domain S-box-containing protein
VSGERDEIFDRLPIGLFRTNPRGEVLRGNRALGALFGLPPDIEVTRHNALDFWLDPDERRDWLAMLEQHGEVQGFDARLRRTDGTPIWVRLSAGVVRNDDGSTRYYEGAAIDVTERRQAADELERSLSLHRATLESTADGILVVDLDGRILSYNRRFAEMWHIPENLLDAGDDERALGFVLEQLVDGAAFLNKVRELYGNLEAESYDELHFKDGRVFERYSRPQRIGGKSVGRVWSFRDITTSRHLEDQLRQSQRLEAVGKLAGGVAHDFNNLLTAILGYSELVQQRLGRGDPSFAQVEEIRSAAERATELTRQLLAFSRKQVLQPRILDLNRSVQATDAMLRRLIGEHIRLVTSLTGDLGSVRADPGQIQQVIVNLALNARDAMPDGGKLMVETRNAWLDEEYARTHVDVEPGAYAVLVISDTGAGMDRETQAHVFEPFFTTKRVGEGTGLGLSTVYGIVRQSRGHIWVYSEPGLGTTVKIYLPVVGELPEALEASVDRGAIPGGDETLLLVEDDAAVRGMISGFLRQLGYRVLEAEDGQQALDLVDRATRKIDLLLTDVVMPEVAGPELGGELSRRLPGLCVLFMTGYPGDALGEHGLLGGDAPLIEKPFTLQELAQRVRLLLDARAPGAASAAAGDQTST